MINKKIHYIWMGNGEKSELIQQCIDSWKKFLPDYEIIEWNETNFDVCSIQYVKEAYENKKWAHVSDYIRLYALSEFGGIYFDTDIQVLKSLDDLLNAGAFIGFESKDYLGTGIIGAEKNHPWINQLLAYYQEKSFYKKDGTLDLAPNVVNITEQTVRDYHLKLNNSYQELKNNLRIYPKEYFCPANYEDDARKKLNRITANSYTIHHYDGSWLTNFGKFKVFVKRTLAKITRGNI